MKVVLDAMGGDYAPEEAVAGAVQAVERFGVDLVFVGDEGRVKPLLDRQIAGRSELAAKIELIHAPEVITFDEHPASAVRRKAESSLVKGIELVKSGDADAFVSAGNTGAVMAAALLKLGRIRGVSRPGIAVPFPTTRGTTILIDGGANAEVKPENLLQFAAMGAIYIEAVVGRKEPTIGLLNIGEEPTKGTPLYVEAHKLLSESGMRFVGNVEGRDLPFGKADVVVCDGFVGNVALKLTEGVAMAILSMIKDALTSGTLSKIGGLLIKPALKGLRGRLDYAEYGGTPLLGVAGVVIISHGSSKARAFMNAVRAARDAVQGRIVERITERMAAYTEDDIIA